MTSRIGSDFLVGGSDLRRTTSHTSLVGQRARETPIASVMQTDAVWLAPETPVRDARELMSSTDARIAVVVSDRMRPIGIVHASQLVDSWSGAPSLEREAPLLALGVEGMRVPVGAAFHEDDGAPDRPVTDVMVRQVTCLPESASIARAAGFMSLRATADVVVTDRDGRACGILSASDVLRWVATELEAAMLTSLDKAAPAETTSAPPPTPAEGAEPTPRAARASSVLVVEDDGVIASQLVEILEDEGYRVRRASDGRDALDALRTMEDKPDLILLDLVMPHMDGWEFRRVQLGDAFLSAIPTVVMTAFSQAADTPELGSVSVLSKPLRLERLLHTVAHLCRGQQPSWN